VIAVLALLMLAFRPGAPAAEADYDFSAVTTIVQNTVDSVPLNGASLLMFKDDQIIYEQYFGAYNANTAVPIASATKWVSSSVFMTLVDDGIVTLDDPVSMYLPNWTGQMGTITLRQLWSFTSGLTGDHACLGDTTTTLDACVELIRQGGLIAAPGAQFYYGGASMQVAGRVAEVATGQTWNSLFADRIKTPLGLTVTTYGTHANPRIGGGVWSRLHEYATLLEMHLNNGVYNGVQVLSQDAITEMQRDQTFGAAIAYTPHPDARRYGLGLWRDIVGAQDVPVQVSSQGAFGFSPWLDRERRYFGVFLVLEQLTNVYIPVAFAQASAQATIDSYDSDGDGQADAADADDDDDGYADAVEFGHPLCDNGVNDDATDDAVVNDGCANGPPQAGTFSEAEFRAGTNAGGRCEAGGGSGPSGHWPADLMGGSFSGDKVNVSDLASFVAPTRHIGTRPGDADFSARHDVVPGTTFGEDWINIVDLANVSMLAPGMPPYGGTRAFGGGACTDG